MNTKLIIFDIFIWSISGMKEHASCSRTCSRTCSCSRTRTEQEQKLFWTPRTRTEQEQKKNSEIENKNRTRTKNIEVKNTVLCVGKNISQTHFRLDRICMVYRTKKIRGLIGHNIKNSDVQSTPPCIFSKWIIGASYTYLQYIVYLLIRFESSPK